MPIGPNFGSMGIGTPPLPLGDEYYLSRAVLLIPPSSPVIVFGPRKDNYVNTIVENQKKKDKYFGPKGGLSAHGPLKRNSFKKDSFSVANHKSQITKVQTVLSGQHSILPISTVRLLQDSCYEGSHAQRNDPDLLVNAQVVVELEQGSIHWRR